ncbi:hemerythrin domain-containing protein [Myxococcaceae bacterium GXIMD 01537]
MDALDILQHEHRQIERVLEVLERALAHGRAGGDVPASLFLRAAHFFLTFVEGNHQAKEGVLFQSMTEQRLPLGPRVLAQVSGEHGLGHEQAQELAEAATAVARERADPEPMFAAAERYVRLHRSHTLAEETQVFPLARRLLAPGVLERVRTRFARIEAAHGAIEEAADAVEVAFPLAWSGARAHHPGRR